MDRRRRVSGRLSGEAAAFDVARHLVEYGGYSGSKRTAIRALQRRLGDDSAGRAERLLDAAIQLLRVTKEVVKQNQTVMWDSWDAERLQLSDNGVGARVQKLNPRFTRNICDSAVAWVFYQYYLR